MNPLLLIFLVTIGLIIAIYASGFLLPKGYENKRTIQLRQPPETVWHAINNMEAMPITGSTSHPIQEINADPDLPAWLIDMGSTQITVQTIEAAPPHKLVRILADAVVPMTARYEYRIEPMGTGSELTIHEEGYIDNGTWHVPIFRYAARLMRGSGVKMYCKQLKIFLEKQTFS